MARIFFSYKNVSISFPQEELERAMSVPMKGGIDLTDSEQEEAAFDIVSRHYTREQVDELGMMKKADFLKLFTID
jgi:hypothetical protein